MSSLNVRLEDPEYRNWVKAGLCLGLLKDGLTSFAIEKSNELHDFVLDHLKKRGSPAFNRICSDATIQYDRYTKNWSVDCSCNSCKDYMVEIYKCRAVTLGATSSQPFTFRQGNFNNTDIQEWPHVPWQMAKVFMNPGQNVASQDAKDCDLSGLLNFIDHCDIARQGIFDTGNISKVRDSRNKIMHSATFKLDENDFIAFTDAMVDLLEDKTVIHSMPDASKAVNDIKEVKESEFLITVEKESKLLTIQTNDLLTANEGIQSDIRDICIRLQYISVYTDTDGKTVSAELQNEIEQREEEMNEAIKIFDSVRKMINRDTELQRDLETDVRQLHDSFEVTRKELQFAQRDIDTVKTRLDELEKRADITDAVTGELERRTGRVEDQIEELKEQSLTLPSPIIIQPVETVSDTNQFRKDYRKLQKYIVGEYERLCTEISLSPVYECPNEGIPKASIDDLNARFHIVRHCEKSEHEIRSYMDMVYDRVTGKKNKTIFVKGEAGIGKSTWCLQVISAWCKTQTIHSRDAVELEEKRIGTPRSQQFCFAWCKAGKQKTTIPKAKSQSSLDSIIESDREKGPTFDFLFFVILRHIRDKLSILDMIFASELQRLSEFRPLVFKIMKEHSESVLIILDGVNEYGQRFDYRGLNQSTVIATTRPWKYDILCAENKVKVDAVFTIKGLKSDDIPEATNNVIGLLNPFKKDSEESDEYNSDDNQSLTKDNDRNLTVDCLQHVESIGMAGSMTVPLTLLTVIQCWLENREALPPPLTCSVLRLLKVIILRGEEKIPSYYLVSHGTENANLVTAGRTISKVMGDEVFTKYLDLFMRLGKLAFEGILLSTPQSLPFTEGQILEYISKEELELCLQLGLITKSNMFDSAISKAREVVAFYHGILQELFAALWIVGNDEEVLSKLKIFTGISKLENVLIFVCGLSPSIGSKFTSTLTAMCNRDSYVEVCDVAQSVCKRDSYVTCVGEIGESVQICESDNWQKLTLLILKCQKEVDESSGPKEDLYISNGVLKGKLNNCVLKLIKQSQSHLRSLELCFVTLSYQEMSQLCQSIDSAVFLQKLDIAIFEIKHIDDDQYHNITLNLSKHNVLKTLKVCDSPEHCIKEINLGNNCNLESIAFVNLAMPQSSWNKCFESLASHNVRSMKLQQLAVDNTVFSVENFMQLESLILEDVSMSQLKLNDNSKLVELGLQNVTMTQSAWNTLFKAVSVACLGKLTLWNINACCADAKADNLAMVDTEGMTVGCVSNNDCFTGMRLRDASFCSVALCQWDCFSELFRYCWMHSLKLAHVNMKEGVLNLEKLEYLQLLSLNDVNVSEMKFGERLIVPNVSVTSVKMSRSSWEMFCAKVLIGKMQNLSLKYSSIPTVLDLRMICRLKMIQLRDLQLNDVVIDPFLDLRDAELRRISMPESAWKKILESIKCHKMTHGMRTFCLESLNFEDAVIDLTSLVELEKLTLLDIKVSALKLGEKRKLTEMNMEKLGMGNVSWNEFFGCLQVQTLRCLTITNIDFDDVVIDLETAKTLKILTVTCVRASDLKLNFNAHLHKVEFEDVSLQNTSWPRLFQRLKSLKISKLTLRTLNVGKAIVSTNRLEMLQFIDLELKNIELGSLTYLRDVDLRRITMPLSAWKKFLESIRCNDMWKGVRTFSLESLTYKDTVIDLTNLLEIEKLAVLDIKVSGLRLGEKSKLTEMHLDKISMPKLAWNALFTSLHVQALRHLTLANINIDDVIVNLESTKVLTTLKVVSVHAFDLHLCSNMPLQTVELENIILHKASWPGLFRRLTPLKLSELTLRNLDIGEAVIRIDKISHLQRLAVTDVNMSDECQIEVNRLLNNVRVHGKKSAR